MTFEFRVTGKKQQHEYKKVITVKDTDFTAQTRLAANSENIRRELVHRLMKEGVVVAEIQPVELC